MCALALAGVGIGIAHPLVTLDFEERGLVVKPIDVEVMFTGVLVFRPGTPLTETARQFMRHMRMQLERDQKALKFALGNAAAEEDEAAVRKRSRRSTGGRLSPSR